MNIEKLKTGDSMYVLSPYEDQGYLDYRIQKVALIEHDIIHSEIGPCVLISFDFVDYSERKQNVLTRLFKTQLESEYVRYMNRAEDEDWDTIYFSDNESVLKVIYNYLIRKRINELDQIIEDFQESREHYVKKL